MRDFQVFLKEAAHVVPTARQLAWYEKAFYAFVHFSPNTYTGLEWGWGNEDPAIFNPTDLDCDQWVAAVKAAGMKGLVLTAKHHDGFCLWQTKYTEHCIRNSPYQNGQGDIVREAAEACRRGGIAFGFYLSPWDRNSMLYGTEAYNDYYKAQLTELLTGYGDIFHVWFDGACGEGPNGRKQVYDFEGYIELVRKYQPHATIFNDGGPDVRWIGNESGQARHAEWAVIPKELARRGCEVQTGPGPLAGDLAYMRNTHDAIGCLSNILYSEGLCFLGAEVDMSIRPGWFYHPEEEPHSLERLFDTYIHSVGGNACFHLNIPPMPNGRFDARDVARLHELGDALRNAFAKNLAESARIERQPATRGDTQCAFTVTFDAPQSLRYITLRENIAQGQRVETFLLQKRNDHGEWIAFFEGTTIGNRRICPVDEQVRAFRVLITAARDGVESLTIEAY